MIEASGACRLRRFRKLWVVQATVVPVLSSAIGLHCWAWSAGRPDKRYLRHDRVSCARVRLAEAALTSGEGIGSSGCSGAARRQDGCGRSSSFCSSVNRLGVSLVRSRQPLGAGRPARAIIAVMRRSPAQPVPRALSLLVAKMLASRSHLCRW